QNDLVGALQLAECLSEAAVKLVDAVLFPKARDDNTEFGRPPFRPHDAESVRSAAAAPRRRRRAAGSRRFRRIAICFIATALGILPRRTAGEARGQRGDADPCTRNTARRPVFPAGGSPYVQRLYDRRTVKAIRGAAVAAVVL